VKGYLGDDGVRSLNSLFLKVKKNCVNIVLTRCALVEMWITGGNLWIKYSSQDKN